MFTCKVLFTICPIVATTDAEAQGVHERLMAEADHHVIATLAIISNHTGIDFSVYPLDEPLGERKWTTNGTQATLDGFIARNRGRTLRQAATASWQSMDGGLGLIGSPDTLAARMCEIMGEVGGDGFLVANETLTRRSIAEIVDGLVPALQACGATRMAYTYDRFRDNLLEF